MEYSSRYRTRSFKLYSQTILTGIREGTGWKFCYGFDYLIKSFRSFHQPLQVYAQMVT